MLIVPIILLIVLVIVVVVANSKKKAGEMSDSSYQTIVSMSSIAVTIAALAVMYLRMR